MTGLESIGLDLVILAGVAVLLIALMLGLHALVGIVPLTRSRREAIHRAIPVAAIGLALAYSIVAVRILLAGHPAYSAAGTALVLLAFGILAFGPLRDVVSGVFLRAGNVCQPGDHVRIDDLHGRVVTMGLRTLVVETIEGEEAIVPYSRVAGERLVRTSSGVEAVWPHIFRVALPDQGQAAVKALIRKSAMLAHWSAVSRVPEVAIVGGRRRREPDEAPDECIEVTVYSLDPDRGPDIEAAVRKAVGE